MVVIGGAGFVMRPKPMSPVVVSPAPEPGTANNVATPPSSPYTAPLLSCQAIPMNGRGTMAVRATLQSAPQPTETPARIAFSLLPTCCCCGRLPTLAGAMHGQITDTVRVLGCRLLQPNQGTYAHNMAVTIYCNGPPAQQLHTTCTNGACVQSGPHCSQSARNPHCSQSALWFGMCAMRPFLIYTHTFRTRGRPNNSTASASGGFRL